MRGAILINPPPANDGRLGDWLVGQVESNSYMRSTMKWLVERTLAEGIDLFRDHYVGRLVYETTSSRERDMAGSALIYVPSRAEVASIWPRYRAPVYDLAPYRRAAESAARVRRG